MRRKRNSVIKGLPGAGGWGLAGAPVVKTLPSDVRDVDLIPGKEAKISYTSKAKKKKNQQNQGIKQEQCVRAGSGVSDSL